MESIGIGLLDQPAMTQTDQIIEHLKRYGQITPIEAQERYGVMRLAARVLDAKERGIQIATEIVTSRNRFGDAVRYALYRWVRQ